MHCRTTLDKNIGKILVESAKIMYDLAKTRQELSRGTQTNVIKKKTKTST